MLTLTVLVSLLILTSASPSKITHHSKPKIAVSVPANIKEMFDILYNDQLAPALANGIPEAGIPSLDPYTQDVTPGSFGLGSDGLFLFEFTDVLMNGFSEAVIDSYDMYNDGFGAYEVDRQLTFVPYLYAKYSMTGKYNKEKLNTTGYINITGSSCQRESWQSWTPGQDASGNVTYAPFDSYEFCNTLSDASLSITGLPDDVLTLFQDYGDYATENLFCGCFMSYVENTIGEFTVIDYLLNQDQQSSNVH